jgi:glyoxylase-like metal-dependent hydrolase (beta-lactamase superfamily II)
MSIQSLNPRSLGISKGLHRIGMLATALALTACASVEPVSLPAAAAALKANDTQSIAFSGTGQWFQFGQAPAPSLPWPAFNVSRYEAAIDYDSRSARVQIARLQVVEPNRARPAPVEQKVDQYIAGAQAWNLPTAAGAAPTPTAQPAAVAERSAEIWSTPQGFLKAALASQATTRQTPEGTEVSFTANGKDRYVGVLNGKGQVERIRTTLSTPLLGDTAYETRFSDYKDFAGTPFPARIVRSQGGHPVLDLKVADVTRNAPAKLSVPAEVASAATLPVTVTATKIADGVHYLTGGTHHSVLIEQADHLVLVEAPLNEERSLALIAKAKELVPGKSIRYVVNTHAHFDHSGGLPTLADAGAIVVTHKGNQAYYEKAWSQPRTLSPGQLAAAAKPARFETFTGKHVLSDGRRQIELYELAGNGHNDAFAVIYLPAEKILIQADAFTPAAPNVPPPPVPNPFSVNLYRNIESLKLDVAQIAPLHGRLVTLADLRAAIGVTTTAQR